MYHQVMTGPLNHQISWKKSR